MKQIGWFLVIAGAVMLEMFTAPGAGLSGQGWKLCRSGNPGKVHFTVERSRPGSRSVNGNDVPLANFRGFTLDMLDHRSPARFEYVQEAGTLVCQGKFSWGRGAGSFTMSPNPAFVSELNRLGFASPREDELFFLMLSNVSLEYARAIQEAGLGASLRQLIELRNRGVTAQYIRDVNRAGYTKFRAQDIIDLRTRGVESGFLGELQSAGYKLRAEEIIDLRMHGVNAKFLEDLKQAGYDLPASQIAELSMRGVNSSYVRDLKFYSLHPPAAELVQLRVHGVTPEYLRGLHDAGLGGLSGDEVVELRQHGVRSEFAAAAKQLGYRFTPRELIDLSTHGVDARYLKTLRDAGMQNLTEPQITQLRMHGVD